MAGAAPAAAREADCPQVMALDGIGDQSGAATGRTDAADITSLALNVRPSGEAYVTLGVTHLPERGADGPDLDYVVFFSVDGETDRQYVEGRVGPAIARFQFGTYSGGLVVARFEPVGDSSGQVDRGRSGAVHIDLPSPRGGWPGQRLRSLSAIVIPSRPPDTSGAPLTFAEVMDTTYVAGLYESPLTVTACKSAIALPVTTPAEPPRVVGLSRSGKRLRVNVDVPQGFDRALVSVRSRGGRLVARRSLASVAPGTRSFTLKVRRPVKAGRYTVELTGWLASQPIRIVRSFRIVNR